ncbi:hypothetical protein D924_00593 [Enterococcus faecalis 06-MB-S-10]|nr:hypothetical protein D924_00593 [Enterococcus faecalis 06-MB-S-10]
MLFYEFFLLLEKHSEEHKGKWGSHKVSRLAVQGFLVGYKFARS